MGENQLNETCLEDFHKVKPDMGIGWGLGMSVIFDPAAALTLAPAHSLSWGGLGGCMNQIDPVNKLSLFVAQKAVSVKISRQIHLSGQRQMGRKWPILQFKTCRPQMPC